MDAVPLQDVITADVQQKMRSHGGHRKNAIAANVGARHQQIIGNHENVTTAVPRPDLITAVHRKNAIAPVVPEKNAIAQAGARHYKYLGWVPYVMDAVPLQDVITADVQQQMRSHGGHRKNAIAANVGARHQQIICEDENVTAAVPRRDRLESLCYCFVPWRDMIIPNVPGKNAIAPAAPRQNAIAGNVGVRHQQIIGNHENVTVAVPRRDVITAAGPGKMIYC